MINSQFTSYEYIKSVECEAYSITYSFYEFFYSQKNKDIMNDIINNSKFKNGK